MPCLMEVWSCKGHVESINKNKLRKGVHIAMS